MKTVDVERENPDLETVISLAREGPVLMLAADGSEFFLSEADDFDKEIESLRSSSSFQRLLDERSVSKHRIPLEEIEREIERELGEQKKRT
jgi:hypothetical protein